MLVVVLLVWVVVYLAVFTWVGYTIGKAKNRPALGFLFGLAGLIGLLVIYMLPAKTPTATPVPQWAPPVLR